MSQAFKSGDVVKLSNDVPDYAKKRGRVIGTLDGQVYVRWAWYHISDHKPESLEKVRRPRYIAPKEGT